MKKFVILTLLSLAFFCASAQNHTQEIGIRGGISSGFEYRAFANDFVSYKALLSFRRSGIQLTGMKEFHNPGMFDFSDQLNFIYGFGAHVGYERWNAYDPRESYYPYYRIKKRTGPIAGLDGLAAVEYEFWEVPLSIGFEVKPYFNLFGKNFFQIQPFDFAFTIKYIF